MLNILRTAICRRDLPAEMSIIAVLIAGGFAKAGYAWSGIGVMAGMVVLAGGIESLRRGLEVVPMPLRWPAR